MSAEKDFDAFAISEMLCDGITTRETMLMRRAWKAATERAAKVVEAEAVEETGPGDRGYNLAIKHCAAAIRGTGGGV